MSLFSRDKAPYRGLRRAGRSDPNPYDFFFDGPDVAGHIRENYAYDGDLLQIFANMSEVMVHKWHHYLPIYERYFQAYRGTSFRFLEIGVSKGGSLKMWREYFGPDALIFGIDIDPNCAQYNGQHGEVRIGSQDDPAFLGDVVEEMGGVDVVLDDGSHMMSHVRKSLDILFPLLSQGGIYMIEDLHTAYWSTYEGGYTASENFFRTLPEILHDMHHWYHSHGQTRPGVGGAVSGIHVHDSIAVLEKGPVHRPVHSQVGAV